MHHGGVIGDRPCFGQVDPALTQCPPRAGQPIRQVDRQRQLQVGCPTRDPQPGGDLIGRELTHAASGLVWRVRAGPAMCELRNDLGLPAMGPGDQPLPARHGFHQVVAGDHGGFPAIQHRRQAGPRRRLDTIGGALTVALVAVSSRPITSRRTVDGARGGSPSRRQEDTWRDALRTFDRASGYPRRWRRQHGSQPRPRCVVGVVGLATGRAAGFEHVYDDTCRLRHVHSRALGGSRRCSRPDRDLRVRPTRSGAFRFVFDDNGTSEDVPSAVSSMECARPNVGALRVRPTTDLDDERGAGLPGVGPRGHRPGAGGGRTRARRPIRMGLG